MTTYNNIASRYGNDIKVMKKDLASINKQIQSTMEKIYRKTNQPNFFEKLMPSFTASQIKRLEQSCEKKQDLWSGITGSEYPYVKQDDGAISSYEKMERAMDRSLESKDGYYHIPDDLCQADFAKELRNDIEEMLQSKNTGIPMDIGLKLEETFREPGMTWLHRTQIGVDHATSLSSIAKDGLICAANDLENTATPCSNYTIFISQVISSYAYRQDTCKGCIIIKTDEEPEIENNLLKPNQIIGYVGSDHGRLHDFISKEDMEELRPENELSGNHDKSQSIEPVKENEPDLIDQMIAEAKAEIEAERSDDDPFLRESDEIDIAG